MHYSCRLGVCVVCCVCCVREPFFTSQHGVLVFGRADQPTNTIDHLALGVHVFFLRLLTEENHYGQRDTQNAHWGLLCQLQNITGRNHEHNNAPSALSSDTA